MVLAGVGGPCSGRQSTIMMKTIHRHATQPHGTLHLHATSSRCRLAVSRWGAGQGCGGLPA